MTVGGLNPIYLFLDLSFLFYFIINACLIVVVTLNAKSSFLKNTEYKIQYFHTLNNSKNVTEWLCLAWLLGVIYTAFLMFELDEYEISNTHEFFLIFCALGLSFFIAFTLFGFLKKYKAHCSALIVLWYIPFTAHLIYFIYQIIRWLIK